MDLGIDYENMTEEQVDAILREHGYEPTLVGKYYKLVAEHEMLKAEYKKIKNRSRTMKFLKCEFETDVIGIYITPLIGYSNVKGDKSLWFGWLWWLVTVRFFQDA